MGREGLKALLAPAPTVARNNFTRYLRERPESPVYPTDEAGAKLKEIICREIQTQRERLN